VSQCWRNCPTIFSQAGHDVAHFVIENVDLSLYRQISADFGWHETGFERELKNSVNPVPYGRALRFWPENGMNVN
jgi:hypothetical protein